MVFHVQKSRKPYEITDGFEKKPRELAGLFDIGVSLEVEAEGVGIVAGFGVFVAFFGRFFF